MNERKHPKIGKPLERGRCPACGLNIWRVLGRFKYKRCKGCGYVERIRFDVRKS